MLEIDKWVNFLLSFYLSVQFVTVYWFVFCLIANLVLNFNITLNRPPYKKRLHDLSFVCTLSQSIPCSLTVRSHRYVAGMITGMTTGISRLKEKVSDCLMVVHNVTVRRICVLYFVDLQTRDAN